MKRILVFLALVAMCASINAQTPTFGVSSVSLPDLAAATSTNLASPVFIDCRHQQYVTIVLKTLTSTTSGNGSNVNVTMYPTYDGTKALTNLPAITLSAAVLTANVPAYQSTNLNPASLAGYLVTTVANTQTNGTTTNRIEFPNKTIAP